MYVPEKKPLEQIIKLFFNKSQKRRNQASKDPRRNMDNIHWINPWIELNIILNKNHSNVSVMDNFLSTEEESEYVRMKLKKSYLDNNSVNTNGERGLFDKLFILWALNPISMLFLCVITEYFELSFFLAVQLNKMKLTFEDYEQLQNVVQLLEDLQYVDMRLKLLPDINAYNSLCVLKYI